MANIISRNFNNNPTTDISTTALISKFETMLKNIDSMINKDSIYSVWIRFQLGTDNNSDKVTFNTASTNGKENLIASLEFKKSGAGVANSFKLTVQYDPFNFGQNPSDEVEALDNILAKALSFDFSETNNQSLKGYLQYGYNVASDTNLVSPKYQCIITQIESSTKTNSGITKYIFEGTSEVAIDSEYTPVFEASKEDENVVQRVGQILYYYYGDSSNPPSFISNTETAEGSPGYNIDVPDELINDSVSDKLPAKNDMTPITYCSTILQGRLSKSDYDKYNSDNIIKDSEKPRYVIYITDSDKNKTIHLTYVNPKEGTGLDRVNYHFTWSNDKNNLVTAWEPNVDLRLYLLQKATLSRSASQLNELKAEAQKLIQEARASLNSGDFQSKYDAAYQAIKAFSEHISQVNVQAKEYPDAVMTLVGIPSDIPIGVELMITPRILQSVSRTAGYYMTKSATDYINTNGIFETKIDVIRLRGFSDSDYQSQSMSMMDELESIKQTQQSSVGSTAVSAGVGAASSSYGGGGGGRNGWKIIKKLLRSYLYEYIRWK